MDFDRELRWSTKGLRWNEDRKNDTEDFVEERSDLRCNEMRKLIGRGHRWRTMLTSLDDVEELIRIYSCSSNIPSLNLNSKYC